MIDDELMIHRHKTGHVMMTTMVSDNSLERERERDIIIFYVYICIYI